MELPTYRALSPRQISRQDRGDTRATPSLFPSSSFNLITNMEESQSLRSLFTSAKDAKTALESRGDTNTESYRDALNAAIAKFHECQRQIGILSLFSSNESLDDVSTGDIQ